MNSWELQKAVFAALDGNVGGSVWDEVPEEEEEDTLYTVIGETTEVPDDTHDQDGSDETITLHTWFRDLEAPGSKALKQELEAIDALLHHQVLALESGGSVFLTRAFTEVLKEEDAETGETWRHGILRYRARTLEAA